MGIKIVVREINILCEIIACWVTRFSKNLPNDRHKLKMWKTELTQKLIFMRVKVFKLPRLDKY